MSGSVNYEDRLIHENYEFFDDRVSNNLDSFALNPDTAKAIENGGGLSGDALPEGGAKAAGAFVARFAAENPPEYFHGEGVETVIYEEAFADFGPKYPELNLSGFANVVDIYGNGEGIDAMGITQAVIDGVLEIDLSSSSDGGLVSINLDKVPYSAFLANISLQLEGKMPASVEDFVDLMAELSGDTLIGEPRDIAVDLLKTNFGPDLDQSDMKAIFEENFIAIDQMSADLPIVNLIWSDGGNVVFDDTPGELLEQEYSLAEEDKVYSNLEFAQEGQVIDKEGNITGAWADGEGVGESDLSDKEQADQNAQAVIANFADNGVGDGTTVPKTAFDDAPFAGGDVSSEEWKTVIRLFRTDVPEAITEEALGRAILVGIVEVNDAGEITDVNLGKVTGDLLLKGLANRFDIELEQPFPIDGFLEGIAYITGDDSINTQENREFLIDNYADSDVYGDDVPGISFESARDIFTDRTMVIDEASNDLDFISINFAIEGEGVSEDEEAPESTGDGSVTIGWKDLTAEESDQVHKEGVTLLADYIFDTASDIGTEADVWASDVHQALLTIPGTTISLEDVQELGKASSPEGTATFTAASIYTLIDEGGIRFETDETGLVNNATIDLSSVGADTDEG